jgi:hypothetical protein
MSLHVSLTAALTKDVLTRVVTKLSSISTTLPRVAIEALVTDRLSAYPHVRYHANNDLGLCVSRLLDDCLFAGVGAETVAQNYGTLRDNDPIVTATIEHLADGIASAVTTPLYDIRHTLPQKTQHLVAAITNGLPLDVRQEGLHPLRQFNWGKLGVPPYRTAAILFAKDRLPCFKNGEAKYYDVPVILQTLPYGEVQAVTHDAVIRPLLEQAMGAGADMSIADDPTPPAPRPDRCHQKSAIDVILSPRAYRQMMLSAVEALRGHHLSTAVVAITDQIDAIEDHLRAITTTTLTQINSVTQIPSVKLIENIEVVLANIQLLRASMVFAKETLLQDKLLLTPTVVQESVMNAFCAEGGTEAMVADYVSYMQIHETAIPNQGVEASVIHTLHPRAHADVQKQGRKLQDLASAKKMKAMQNTLMHTLDVYYHTERTQGRLDASFEGIHTQQRTIALATLASKSLDDIALDYLVAMKHDPFTATLYRAIHTELVSLVKNKTEITPVDVATATCAAVVTVTLDKLMTGFARAEAA